MPKCQMNVDAFLDACRRVGVDKVGVSCFSMHFNVAFFTCFIYKHKPYNNIHGQKENFLSIC